MFPLVSCVNVRMVTSDLCETMRRHFNSQSVKQVKCSLHQNVLRLGVSVSAMFKHQ